MFTARGMQHSVCNQGRRKQPISYRVGEATCLTHACHRFCNHWQECYPYRNINEMTESIVHSSCCRHNYSHDCLCLVNLDMRGGTLSPYHNNANTRGLAMLTNNCLLNSCIQTIPLTAITRGLVWKQDERRATCVTLAHPTLE